MLYDEIEVAQRSVKTDAYQMSVGELVNMYKDGELVINPDFQRLFRWGASQKSKLIESILLGIPLPPIFVFEREDSTWELIDGLQRMSTLLEFMGLLRSAPENAYLPPSFMNYTKYLPSLGNVVWEKSDQIAELDLDSQIELEKVSQLAIRRARIGVEILKRPSDNKTKFDLFQRLNAGGIQANAQELRNCIMIMVSEGFFQGIKSLANSNDFLTVLSASADQLERQRHMEYASRFLVQTFIPYDGKLDVEDYIDEGMSALATRNDFALMDIAFRETFGLLNKAFGADALRRMDNGRPSGRVGLAAFECISVGIGRNLQGVLSSGDPVEFVRDRIRGFWDTADLSRFFAPGLRGTMRLQRTLPYGEALFAA